MKSFIAYLTCLTFTAQAVLFPLAAHADEQVTTVEKGDPAPFSGTLLSTEAAARLLLDLETNKEFCRVETERELQIQESKFQLQIDNLQSSLAYCNESCALRLAIKTEQIDYLSTELTRKKVHPAWVFVGGILAGTAITLGSGYTIYQISQGP